MKINGYDFVEVGNWKINEKLKSGIDYSLREDFCNLRAVYAFVVDDEVKYIGICYEKDTKLKDRMRTQRYNKCMPCLIKNELNKGKDVKIFALEPNEIECHGIKVDPVRFLEPDLIFKPKWNAKTAQWSLKQKPSKPKE